jgi:hypothetical protein
VLTGKLHGSNRDKKQAVKKPKADMDAYKKFVHDCSMGYRDEVISAGNARTLAEQLADEKRFFDVLANKSHTHLRHAFVAYKEIYHETIVETIQKRIHEKIRPAVLAFVCWLISPDEHFAERLYDTLGLDSDEIDEADDYSWETIRN